MKRMMAVLMSLPILFLASAASAVPMTWTDTFDPSMNVLITNWGSLEFKHDINDDGFDPTMDTVDSATLMVSIYDDGGMCDGFEVALINQPGFLENGQFVDRLYNFSFNSNTLGVSLSGLAQINTYGMLTVKVQSLLGDFYFDKSVLTASGTDNSQAVPEPGTLLLLGTGLLGLGLIRRKKSVR